MSYGFPHESRTPFSRRYSRWDGTQQIADFTADDIMEAISDDLLSDGDLYRALQRLFRQGMDTQSGSEMPGIRDMLERLRNRRQQELNRYDLGSVLEDLKQRLDEIKELERNGIEERVNQGRERTQGSEQGIGDREQGTGNSEQDAGESGHSSGDQSASEDTVGAHGGAPSQQGGQSSEETDPEQARALQEMLERMAQRNLDTLDSLPSDPAGQIKELSDYEFMDQEARQKFQELVEELQQQVMQQTFQGMQQSMQNMSQQDMAEMQNMLSELNQMLEDRAMGQEPDFDRFMHKYGHFFGGQDINSLDDLMDHMAQQMAAMQSMLDSMTPEQRMELWQAMQSVMNDPGIQQEMGRLSENLSAMMPDNPYAQQYQFQGGEEMSLAEALRMMDRLQDMDEVEDQLRGIRDWRDLENLDDQKLRDLLGDDFQHDIDQLRQLTKMLEDAGYIERNGGSYEMTPRGIRKIGQKALNDIFHQLQKDRIGQHAVDRAGFGTERTDEDKPYEFGDPFLLNLPKTVMNSVWREGPGSPVHLEPTDFEVYQTEMMSQTSTVLMVDMSRSMLYNGCFMAAKKVALALDSLIRSQFPRDNLYIVGFSYIATELKPKSLPMISWDEYNYGTNMQHGLMLARQFLSRHKGGNKQVIIITDGEPTAHFEGGQVQFSYPPTYQTLQETLKEVVRCTREDVTINTFMLERSPYMAGFVSEMAKINKGRAFFATPDHLGEYLLVDYVSNKRRVTQA